MAPPYHYELSWAPYEVSDLTLKNPDGVALNHFQRFKPVEKFDVPGNYVRLDHCAIMTESLAEVRRFGAVGGWDSYSGYMEVPDGPVNKIMRLPQELRIRVSDWGIKGETSAGIEFIEVTPNGHPAVERPCPCMAMVSDLLIEAAC